MHKYNSVELKPLVVALVLLLIVLFVATYSLGLALGLSLLFNVVYLFRLSKSGLFTSDKFAAKPSQDGEKDKKALEEKNQTLENTERAVLNILEDTQELEAVLQKERDRLQAVLLAMTDGVLVFSTAQKLVLANQSGLKMLELTEQKAYGQEITKIFTIYQNKQPMPLAEWPNVKTLNQGKPQTLGIEANLYLRCLSGEIFPVSISTAPLQQEGKVWGIVMIIRNITVEKNLDEARSNFISTASHQLRTPLTSLRWFAEMLLTADAGKLNKEQKNLVEEILNSSTRMISLVAMLLQIARIEAGRVKLNPQPLDLKKMTESVIQTFKGTVTENQQIIKLTVKQKLPTIILDQVIVWQVLQNLLSNAIKYSPKKSTIAIQISVLPKMVEWVIKDQGIGIPKEQQARIFEKFFRADNAISFAPEGSGLGLPLVKNLVEGWGGELSFESESSQGTKFRITFPIKN